MERERLEQQNNEKEMKYSKLYDQVRITINSIFDLLKGNSQRLFRCDFERKIHIYTGLRVILN